MRFKEGENVHVIVGNELLSGWYNGKEFGTDNSLVKVSRDKIIATKDCFIAKEKEAELAVVPRFVADWISHCKQERYDLSWSINYDDSDMPYDIFEWLNPTADNQELFARAWMDGYEVEKEPLYYVRFINNCSGYLNVRNDERRSLSDSVQNDIFKTQFTEAEIREMDERYWQFAVPVEDSEGEA
ncbi:DUF1642 domain-containing protein [Listeria monocytogenes]|nr:DUF1642 domain-containing protein [Listeria monocytogenes]EHR3660603.1 DUF1642 domain-containing protein [Listeria monocytogenes]EIJ0798726.1 DUF1642 domain-containing protein [Listeria monocytogenes]